MRKYIATILLFITFACPLYAEDLYVNPSGNGTNPSAGWTTGWASLSAIVWGDGDNKLGAGDTLWVSGGVSGVTYSEDLIFGASGSAGNPIMVRIGAAHPTLSAGHNGKVTISGIVQPDDQTNIVISGEFAEVNSNPFSTGFTTDKKLVVTHADGVCVHYKGVNTIMKYMEVGPCGTTQDVDHAFFSNPTTGAEPTGIEIAYNYIHDAAGDGINNSRSNLTDETSSLIHHNYIYHNDVDGLQAAGGVSFYNNMVDLTGTVEGTHGDGIQAAAGEWRIYNNTFKGCPQSIFMESSGVTQTLDNIQIYNNVFYPGSYAYTLGITLKSKLTESGAVAWSNVLIANNTFDTLLLRQAIEIQDATQAYGDFSFQTTEIANNIFYNINYANAVTMADGNYTDTDILFKNNLFYSNQAMTFDGVSYATLADLVAAHSGFTGNVVGQPSFADYSGHNYRLSGSDAVAKNAGKAITAFTIDKNGVTRPIGTLWDIGAYEYNGNHTLGSGPQFSIGLGATVTIQ